jgi:hypothetical protein
MHEDAREHRVLEHVGEISGVKGVPIVHGAQSCAQMHCCKGVEGRAVRAAKWALGWKSGTARV